MTLKSEAWDFAFTNLHGCVCLLACVAYSHASWVLAEQHVYASWTHVCQLPSTCLALCVVTFAQNESRMSYLSTTLQILFRLLSWHGNMNLTAYMFSRVQVFMSLMHVHQGCLTGCPVYPTLWVKVKGMSVFNAHSSRMPNRASSIPYPYGLYR